MKKRSLTLLSVLVFAVIATGAAGADLTITQFQSWVDRYLATAPSQRSILVAEGLQLATNRQPVFQKLIRENPQQALTLALPPATLAQMPTSVRSQLEYWVSGRASTSLFRADESTVVGINDRLLLIRGVIFHAHVDGRRLNQVTFWDNPIFGVAMKSDLAVAGSPVHVLESPSSTNTVWRLDVGGQICTFNSETEWRSYEQAIITCEQVEIDKEAKLLAGRPTSVRIAATVTFSEKDFLITRENGFDTVQLLNEDMPIGTPGAPWLPTKTINVQIPAGAMVTNITVQTDEQLWRTGILVRAAQYLTHGLPERPTPVCDPDPVLYASKSYYPAKTASNQPPHRSRGVSLVPIRIYPVRYLPAQQKLTMARNVSLTLDCALPAARPAVAYEDAVDMKEVLDLLKTGAIVPEGDPQIRTPPAPSPVLGPQDRCQYLIITAERFRDSFAALAEHRRAGGFSVNILSTEWIAENYAGWPDGTACPLTASIRHCIRDYVQNRGTHYVLLGGDTSVVPAEYGSDSYTEACWDIPPWCEHTESAPSDVWYSGLDYDPMKVFGFWYNPADFSPDVLLGRLPFRSNDTFAAYGQQVIDYETNSPLHLASKVLLVGNELWNHYSGNDRPSDGMNDNHDQFFSQLHTVVSDAEMWLRRAFRDKFQANRWDYMPQMVCDTLATHDNPVDPCGNYDLTPNNLLGHLSLGWNYVLHFSHGGTGHWCLETENLNSGSVHANNPVLFIYSGGCQTAAFDTENCIGSMFLAKAGTMAYIGSSGKGFGTPDEGAADRGSTGGPIMTAMRSYFQYLFSGPLRARPISHAFNAHKNYLGSRADEYDYCYLAYIQTFFGDPAIRGIGLKPSVEMVCRSPNISEGAATDVTLFRHGDLTDPLTVSYRLRGTARPDLDFSTTPPRTYGGDITFPAGADRLVVEFFAEPDAVMDPNETIIFEFNTSDDYEIVTTMEENHIVSRGTMTLTIANTTGPYTLTVTPAVPTAREGVEPPGLFRITRTGPADLSDHLQFEFSLSGTADLNTDLDPVRSAYLLFGYGTFSPGQRNYDLQVVPNDDNQQENPETVTLQLLPARDDSYQLTGNPAEPTRATVTIFSEDQDPTVRITSPAGLWDVETGERITIAAEAADVDDGVTRVEFYLDNIRLGSDTAAPYSVNVVVPWPGSEGIHQLKAKVTDRSGVQVWSAPVDIWVRDIPPGTGTGILRELWDHVPGRDLVALRSDPRYPQRPTERDEDWGFFCNDGYPDWGENYGERLRGYFIAPTTGDYRFLLQGNDYAELWLSTDSNPAHKRQIAVMTCNQDLDDESLWPTRTTDVVQLEAGYRYYIEAFHKESTDYDWLKVGVDLPGGRREMPIPGHRLQPWVVEQGLQITTLDLDPTIETIQVAEGAPVQSYIMILTAEPEADVRVNIACDTNQVVVAPTAFLRTRANWWQPQGISIRAVDDRRAEVSPQAVTVTHTCVSADDYYQYMSPVTLTASVLDNDTNLAPRVTRVWPKVRQVRTRAATAQICFEISATDDGQPGPMTYAWGQRTGANLGTGTVSNTRTTATLGTFPRTGSYEVVSTVSDGWAQSNLDFAVQTAAPLPAAGKLVNFAPAISAGPDMAVTPGLASALRGTAVDDGQPANPGALTVQWVKVSGPGTVTFGNAAAANTTVQIKTLGVYVLRLTAHDGEVKVFDDVTVTVR